MNRAALAAIAGVAALSGALFVTGTLALRGVTPLPLLLGELVLAAFVWASANVTSDRRSRRGARSRTTAPVPRRWRTSIRRTLLLIDSGDPYTVAIHRLGPRTRLLARLRSHELDRQLARGANPDSSALLSVRAAQLQSPGHRRTLAHGYRRRLTVSRRDPRPTGIPLARVQVRACAELIEELATLLEAGEPIQLGAIARAGLLLSEPTSPMYVKARDQALAGALRRVIAALRTPPGEADILSRP